MKDDIYSDTVRAIYDRLQRNDITTCRDFDVMLDYRTVVQASMTYLDDDARKKVSELEKCLEEEISYRMSKWRVQAQCASQEVYDRLTSYC